MYIKWTLYLENGCTVMDVSKILTLKFRYYDKIGNGFTRE